MTVADDLATLRDPFGRTTFEQRTLAANRLEDEIARLTEQWDAWQDSALKEERRAQDAEAEVARLLAEKDKWHEDAEMRNQRAEAALARETRLRDGLRAIADRVYPAIYIGEAKDGTKMYGGSDDASRFARSLLDESDAT